MSRDTSGPVETVENVRVMGANVMEGTWADGSTDVQIWNADPIAAETAADWPELLPEEERER